MHKTDLLLPHDPTYHALKHLVQTSEGAILDIGANQGISALSFRKMCPDHKIISFEPNLSLAENLRQVESRIENFEYHLIGLGDEDGEFTLYTPWYGKIALHTFSSFDEENVRSAVNLTYKPKIRDKINIIPTQCRIRKLDELNIYPEVIKIDAEGLEHRIFRGGENTLKKYSPSIIFEACHSTIDEATRLLKDYGYRILSYSVKNDCFSDFSDEDSVQYVSGLRNLIAVSEEKYLDLPIMN
ncbi:FkbM family methyltransferase [Thalassospira lucentensis]|uniref:FkbM family methyltransferase n=1 Tax=Thalassospira lucentensis TaxID=168935 RepID=UPI002942A39A|nr:FkbM family methyltransferase [Thalassospira lucentensis]WOI11817.1 FkbM family methyltransferase [Thalassospira lucentensis]